jgi:monoamine oxidase
MSRSFFAKLHSRFGKPLSNLERNARIKKLIIKDLRNFTSISLTADCRTKLKKTRVAVIGGGFAGMMAAWWLCHRENGIQVKVFEANSWLGGRVRSDSKFSSCHIVEDGAELVGANFPVWLSLARVMGVGLMLRTEDEHYQVFEYEPKVFIDRLLSEVEAKKLYEDMDAILKKFGVDAAKIKDPSQPWLDTSLAPFDKMTVADKLAQLKINKTDLVYRGIELLLSNDLVTPLDKINYLALLCLVKAGQFGNEDTELMGFWEQTEVFRCTNGCQELVLKMAAQLKDAKYKFQLLLNAKVKTITISDTGVKLNYQYGSAQKAEDFDYVIFTVPPSVWDKITITPLHPKDIIGSVQMGNSGKFFSALEDRFWIEEQAAPSGISSKIGMIWESTDNQILVTPKEAVIAVFAGNSVPSQAEFIKGLKDLYKGYEKSSKGRKKKVVNWNDVENIKTGYSCPMVGHIFAKASDLQFPFKGRLFLAGEHTQTDFFGFMEGSLRSGRRSAEAVIQKVCPPPGPVMVASGEVTAQSGGLGERLAFEREMESLLGDEKERNYRE